MSYKPIR